MIKYIRQREVLNTYRWLLFLGFLVALSAPGLGQPRFQVYGMPQPDMEYYAVEQESMNWCWAACIEMCLEYYGVNISQRRIVARTWGAPDFLAPDLGGQPEQISANLNNWSVDESGREYIVRARYYFRPGVEDLREIFALEKPVILAYGPDPRSGHAVVASSMAIDNKAAPYPTVMGVTVHDPWPVYLGGLGRSSARAVPGLSVSPWINGGGGTQPLPYPIWSAWVVDVLK